MKLVYMFAYIGLVACAVDTGHIDEGHQYDPPPDNSNVSCVVNGANWSCNANTWTWTFDNQERSCSNTGTCKDGSACVLWNGDVGVCQEN